jgi:hypothetical protein
MVSKSTRRTIVAKVVAFHQDLCVDDSGAFDSYEIRWALHEVRALAFFDRCAERSPDCRTTVSLHNA